MNYAEATLNIFSTSFKCSLFAKKTTKSSFSNIKSDRGIITFSFLTIAPTLICSGNSESFIALFNKSDLSKISAYINSYSPSKSE